MKLIIVPRWLEQTLSAHGLPLSAVTDVKKVLSITSAEDVSVYVHLNMYPFEVSGAHYPHTATFLMEQALAIDDERLSAHLQYLSIGKSNKKDNPLENLIGRNFVEGAPLCYSCTVLDDEHILITLDQHEVGTPTEEVCAAEQQFKERLFGQYLLKNKLTDLSTEPVFLNYLKGLCV